MLEEGAAWRPVWLWAESSWAGGRKWVGEGAGEATEGLSPVLG